MNMNSFSLEKIWNQQYHFNQLRGKEEKENDSIKDKGEGTKEDKKFVLKMEKPSVKRKFSLKAKEKLEQYKRIKRENKKKKLMERLDENT